MRKGDAIISLHLCGAKPTCSRTRAPSWPSLFLASTDYPPSLHHGACKSLEHNVFGHGRCSCNAGASTVLVHLLFVWFWAMFSLRAAARSGCTPYAPHCRCDVTCIRVSRRMRGRASPPGGATAAISNGRVPNALGPYVGAFMQIATPRRDLDAIHIGTLQFGYGVAHNFL